MSESVFVFSSAPVVTIALLSGLTLVSTPENGLLRLLECGPPTRYKMSIKLSKLNLNDHNLLIFC